MPSPVHEGAPTATTPAARGSAGARRGDGTLDRLATPTDPSSQRRVRHRVGGSGKQRPSDSAEASANTSPSNTPSATAADKTQPNADATAGESETSCATPDLDVGSPADAVVAVDEPAPLLEDGTGYGASPQHLEREGSASEHDAEDESVSHILASLCKAGRGPRKPQALSGEARRSSKHVDRVVADPSSSTSRTTSVPTPAAPQGPPTGVPPLPCPPTPPPIPAHAQPSQPFSSAVAGSGSSGYGVGVGGPGFGMFPSPGPMWFPWAAGWTGRPGVAPQAVPLGTAGSGAAGWFGPAMAGPALAQPWHFLWPGWVPGQSGMPQVPLALPGTAGPRPLLPVSALSCAPTPLSSFTLPATTAGVAANSLKRALEPEADAALSVADAGRADDGAPGSALVEEEGNLAGGGGAAGPAVGRRPLKRLAVQPGVSCAGTGAVVGAGAGAWEHWGLGPSAPSSGSSTAQGCSIRGLSLPVLPLRRVPSGSSTGTDGMHKGTPAAAVEAGVSPSLAATTAMAGAGLGGL